MSHDIDYCPSVVGMLVSSGARSVAKYIDEKTVVRATRRTFRGKIDKRKNAPIEILLHIGRPNYAERQFIKTCKKASEPFPVKKLQFKWPKEA